MSHKILIQKGLLRQEIFENLSSYLLIIQKLVNQLDPIAEIYLFGSVAENTHTFRSDIDILIVTDKDPALIHKALWEVGVKEPFEIHIHSKEHATTYKKRATLIKVDKIINSH